MIMAVGLSFNAGATKKVFKANKKKITLTEKKKKNVTITNSIGTNVKYNISNKMICSCKWGKWKGNRIKLTITAKKPGKTKITIKSNRTKKQIKIVIKVKKSKKTVKEKTGLEKLKDYIQEYGFAINGDKAISMDYNDATMTIYYLEYLKKFYFVYEKESYTTVSGKMNTVNMTGEMYMDLNGNSTVLVNTTSKVGSWSVSGEATIEVSTFNHEDNPAIRVSYSSVLGQDNAYDIAISGTKLCMSSWNLLLVTETGLNMSDIGFLNY